MTVKEFCKKYNIAFQTVYKKIKRHKNKELAEHITKNKGSPVELDDYAVDFLKPQKIKNEEVNQKSKAIGQENKRLNSELERLRVKYDDM